MNIIFVTQGASLKMFYALIHEVRDRLALKRVGYYVADRSYFDKFSQKNKDIHDYPLLKEWEIVNNSKRLQLDPELLERYGEKLGDPTLWSPVICDRRIYSGDYCKVTQDYKPRYSEYRIKQILQSAVVEIERFIEDIQPDLILSFVPVTFGDYLFHSFANSRGIRYLHLKSTKIENNVTLSSNIFEQPGHIYRRYYEIQDGTGKSDFHSKATVYYNSSINRDLKYEGVVQNTGRQGKKLKSMAAVPFRLIKSLGAQVMRPDNDHHVPNLFITQLYQSVIKPWREYRTHRKLQGLYVGEERFADLKYVFFPLNTEPEIALSVYGRYYLNQIELARNIAQNLPINMYLLIKDHPRSIGQRSLRYYEKLLEIPNVLMASPYMGSDALIRHASAVVVVSGFIGFEAVMKEKPVITLGHCPYNILPDTMVRYVDNIKDFGFVFREFVDSYRFQKQAVINYIAATMEMSAPINLYTEVLQKPGRYTVKEGDAKARSFKGNIEMLADYLCRRLQQVDK